MGSYEIQWKRSAEGELRKLDPQRIPRIIQAGRRVACERGLSITGTVGVLVEARERGLIPSLRQELDRLIEAGMWIHEVFYHRIL